MKPYPPRPVTLLPPREPAPWQHAAACRGLPARTVFARRERDALPALRACLRCPVQQRCEETVAPAESWFDGVSAGRLWRNGRPVTLRLLKETEAA
ncbi:WhiB family transcriptional regulator [Streptomyces sp. JJ36]|uniref:WhiB family transcriptional regulator n=1 Tax=Streptomyces sp. JJ36 TaxID=2736645 RepID=UPI001F253C0B|nr:WhiB family transcriptional regulator [Streptomyces sp. JJ36]